MVSRWAWGSEEVGGCLASYSDLCFLGSTYAIVAGGRGDDGLWKEEKGKRCLPFPPALL